MEEDIMKLDLYEIIGIASTATVEEIKKAYRKQALKCHPDKNPDNPKAAEEFRQLTKVLEVLTDVSARAAYDKILNAKTQAKLRVKELDARHKKFKDNLEAREQAFEQSQSSNYAPSKSDEQRLKAELERLKKEGSKLVEEENERLRQKVLEEIQKRTEEIYGEDACRVKISWKVNADDETNGGYNHDNLSKMLSKHGDISVLVVSSAKKGRALVEFTTKTAAESAITIERGLITNPLKLIGLWEKKKTAATIGQKQLKKPLQMNSRPPIGGSLFASVRGKSNMNSSNISQGLSFASAPDIFNTQTLNHTDFESTVLNNLKRVEERRKLIEQMQTEDT
ncbi:dnaJ homolog subfamily C member 17 [Phymastichus coffea]|uniref:dnaJ homolog subfamily C member 17 n=1 Tax=Phymastichus coffea TaxID=108790 RepID=UPI00273CD64B|nr:dnaJ homolog subfamily C member 17 [Phymastichus coffea]